MRTREAPAHTGRETAPKADAKPRSRRLPFAIVSAALLLTGTLLLLHRPSAEILVDTKATHFSFTVAFPYAPLRGVSGAELVELAGLAKVQQEGVPELTAGPDGDLQLRVESDTATKNPGTFGFDALLIPAGAQIDVTGSEKSIDLRFQYAAGAAAATLDLDISGDVLIRVTGQERRKASFAAPVRITAIPAGDVQLVARFHSNDIAFPVPVAVESVAWSQDARLDLRYPGGTRVQSSILSGRVSLEEFKDRFVNLRNGQTLRLCEASGLVRQLNWDGKALTGQFDGAAKELSIGEGNRRQNLMPTWLDWLRQRDALLQFWAVALYLAGLGLTLTRWWKGSE